MFYQLSLSIEYHFLEFFDLMIRYGRKKFARAKNLQNDFVFDTNTTKPKEGTANKSSSIQSSMSEPSLPKLNDILRPNSTSQLSTKISFRKVENLGNLWVWVGFEEYPTTQDRENFCDAINAFYITGKLGGFNSLNLQVFFCR
jgi:hypothetical protein